MIKYTLKCEHGHQFESWFESANAYDKLFGAGMVTCSVCGTLGVEKSIMAPRVQTSRERPAKGPLSQPASPAEQALAEMRKKIEAEAENVGGNFAKEARKIHDGEAPERSIIGEAKIDDAKALIEDGIPVVPLPWGRNKRSN
ncbi:hypothetical protein BFP76_02860 [Amylibacter kogurei]|uniref:DUF1178 domain-containing protein n=1 Tax=Paramylibacter kogurei TaxID=1889778 RepID=A0A2G5K3S0_9RHOB|nr:DUF1178 family protein [Amylibacter kogurei]PIB24187.1 hypothetical protein BFP76_02860 [Amylibacter kogurei]